VSTGVDDDAWFRQLQPAKSSIRNSEAYSAERAQVVPLRGRTIVLVSADYGA